MWTNFNDSKSDRKNREELRRTVHDFWYDCFDTYRTSEQYKDWWFHRRRHFDVFFLAISKNSSLIRLMTKLEILAILVIVVSMMKLETKLLMIERKLLRSWSKWEKNLICEFDDLQTKMIVWFENLISKKY